MSALNALNHTSIILVWAKYSLLSAVCCLTLAFLWLITSIVGATDNQKLLWYSKSLHIKNVFFRSADEWKKMAAKWMTNDGSLRATVIHPLKIYTQCTRIYMRILLFVCVWYRTEAAPNIYQIKEGWWNVVKKKLLSRPQWSSSALEFGVWSEGRPKKKNGIDVYI